MNTYNIIPISIILYREVDNDKFKIFTNKEKSFNCATR